METGQRITSLQVGYNLSERMIYMKNITRYSGVFSPVVFSLPHFHSQ